MAGNAPSTVRTASPNPWSVRRLWVVVCCFLAVMVATVSQGAAAVWTHGGHSTYEQVLVHEREIARGNARHHPAPAADSPVDHHADEAAQHASERHDPCAHDASGPVQVPDGPQVVPGSSASVAFAGAVQAAFVSTATLTAGVGSREPRVGLVLLRRQGFPPPPVRPPISPSE